MTDLDGPLRLAEELADRAVRHVRGRPAGRQEFETKQGPADLVTATDRAIEEQVRQAIAEAYPEHRVVGEEMGGDAAAGVPAWYVDPVDGTTNFAHGLPGASFSLAYDDGTAPVVGVVADLARGILASAARGRGARRDGQPVRCLDVTSLAGEVVLTEWRGHRAWPGMAAMLTTLADGACTTRILGSSALDLALVATGNAAGAVLGGYNRWDVLAGLVLARESGAVVLGRDGPTDDLPTDGLAVAAPGVAEQLWHAWTATP